jgi:hypothetical protein
MSQKLIWVAVLGSSTQIHIGFLSWVNTLDTRKSEKMRENKRKEEILANLLLV